MELLVFKIPVFHRGYLWNILFDTDTALCKVEAYQPYDGALEASWVEVSVGQWEPGGLLRVNIPSEVRLFVEPAKDNDAYYFTDPNSLPAIALLRRRILAWGLESRLQPLVDGTLLLLVTGKSN